MELTFLKKYRGFAVTQYCLFEQDINNSYLVFNESQKL